MAWERGGTCANASSFDMEIQLTMVAPRARVGTVAIALGSVLA